MVLGLPRNARWRTAGGLAFIGVRYFGDDVDYAPVQEPFRA